jgi:hypothetical protein
MTSMDRRAVVPGGPQSTGIYGSNPHADVPFRGNFPSGRYGPRSSVLFVLPHLVQIRLLSQSSTSGLCCHVGSKRAIR